MPGWQQQQPEGKSNKLPILLAAGGVVVLGVLVLVLFATGVLGSSGPESAVKDMYDASQSGDCDTVIDSIYFGEGADQMANAKFRQQACANIGGSNAADVELISVEETSSSGDTASVEVGTEANGEQQTTDLELKQVDGDWKVDFSRLFGGLQKGMKDLPDDLPTDVPTDLDDLPTDFDDLPDDLGENGN